MGNILIIIGISVAILLLVLSMTSFEIREEVEIQASPEEVWEVIVDFDSYSEWNSQLEYLGGEVEPGGTLQLKLTAEGAEPYEFSPVISHWEEPTKFAWLARTGLPRVFDGEHFFELERIDENTTRVVNREEYRGVLSQVIRNLPMMQGAPEGFRLMNQELKERVEQKVENQDNEEKTD